MRFFEKFRFFYGELFLPNANFANLVLIFQVIYLE